jgi:ankyrin repeat protein
MVRLAMAICTLALGWVAPVAHAANMADWWIYVANDTAFEIKPLLDQGANPNRRSDAGQPAIMQAMRDHAWKVFDLLAADPHTDVNAANKQNETPLMFLAILGETARAQKLIDRGAKINGLGWTALHYAASTGKLPVAQLLISRGAIINSPAPDGTTPLMMAARSHNEEMVDLLVRAGADATTRNLSGLSAGDWARSANSADLGKKLDQEAQRQTLAREAGAAPRLTDTPTSTHTPTSQPTGGAAPAYAPAATPLSGAPGDALSVPPNGVAPSAADAAKSSVDKAGNTHLLRGVQGVRLGE